MGWDIIVSQAKISPLLCNIAVWIVVVFTGMHVGFLLPEGKTMYDSFEDDGYVEICLMLSSEYQPLLGTNANILVTLTPVQTTLTIFVEGGRVIE